MINTHRLKWLGYLKRLCNTTVGITSIWLMQLFLRNLSLGRLTEVIPTRLEAGCQKNQPTNKQSQAEECTTYGTGRCSRRYHLHSPAPHRSATAWGCTGHSGKQSPSPHRSSSLHQWKKAHTRFISSTWLVALLVVVAHIGIYIVWRQMKA